MVIQHLHHFQDFERGHLFLRVGEVANNSTHIAHSCFVAL